MTSLSSCENCRKPNAEEEKRREGKRERKLTLEMRCSDGVSRGRCQSVQFSSDTQTKARSKEKEQEQESREILEIWFFYIIVVRDEWMKGGDGSEIEISQRV